MRAAFRHMSSIDPAFMVQNAKQLEKVLICAPNPRRASAPWDTVDYSVPFHLALQRLLLSWVVERRWRVQKRGCAENHKVDGSKPRLLHVSC